jgi:hypothetical protein
MVVRDPPVKTYVQGSVTHDYAVSVRWGVDGGTPDRVRAQQAKHRCQDEVFSFIAGSSCLLQTFEQFHSIRSSFLASAKCWRDLH